MNPSSETTAWVITVFRDRPARATEFVGVFVWIQLLDSRLQEFATVSISSRDDCK